MIYVYCQRGSTSARALSDELGGRRLRSFDGRRFWRKNKPVNIGEGDVIICWGEAVPQAVAPKARILNAKKLPNKYKVALELNEAGVPTIETYRAPAPAEGRSWKHEDKHWRDEMEHGGWIPRMFNHVGGNDLLKPPTVPDFWSKKVNLKDEFRLHIINGKCVRAGKKILRDGFSLDGSNGTQKASDWIRSYDAGWKVSYDEFKTSGPLREVCQQAVKVLGLDFGAVDVGKTDKGKYIILEVNRAPGMEGNTIKTYAAKLKEWIDEPAGLQTDNDESAPAESTAATVTPTPAAAQPAGDSYHRTLTDRIQQQVGAAARTAAEQLEGAAAAAGAAANPRPAPAPDNSAEARARRYYTRHYGPRPAGQQAGLLWDQSVSYYSRLFSRNQAYYSYGRQD